MRMSRLTNGKDLSLASLLVTYSSPHVFSAVRYRSIRPPPFIGNTFIGFIGNYWEYCVAEKFIFYTSYEAVNFIFSSEISPIFDRKYIELLKRTTAKILYHRASTQKNKNLPIPNNELIKVKTVLYTYIYIFFYIYIFPNGPYFLWLATGTRWHAHRWQTTDDERQLSSYKWKDAN